MMDTLVKEELYITGLPDVLINIIDVCLGGIKNMDLKKFDFTYQDLSNIDLSFVDLSNHDFTGAICV